MTFELKYELKNAVINVSSKLVVGQPNIRQKGFEPMISILVSYHLYY